MTPPPEAKPNEYGRPMLMSYSVIQDVTFPTNVKEEMKKCAEYYKNEQDYVNFGERYLNNSLYMDKLKSTLISKFPRDESETLVWKYIKEILGYSVEESDSLLSIPSVSKSQLIPGLNSSLTSNLMLPTDISSLLFNSGKFPSASSLLGLPDPMAHSTLAANNMFLSTNLFKMQELLKPLSSSSPLPASKKGEKHSPIKIPTDIKGTKSDFAADLLNLKNKLDFIAPDLNLSKSDYSDLSVKSGNKSSDFSVPDYTLNLSSNKMEQGDEKSKILKSDYLDFSKHGEDLNVGGEIGEDRPLNLAGD